MFFISKHFISSAFTHAVPFRLFLSLHYTKSVMLVTCHVKLVTPLCVHAFNTHTHTLPLVALLLQEGSYELGSAVMPWSHYVFIFIPPLPSALLSPL